MQVEVGGHMFRGERAEINCEMVTSEERRPRLLTGDDRIRGDGSEMPKKEKRNRVKGATPAWEDQRGSRFARNRRKEASKM